MRYDNSIETQDIFTYMKKYANPNKTECLITIESKMQFFRYLDINMDNSTSIFINSDNSRFWITEGSPKRICANRDGSYNRVTNTKTAITERVFSGHLYIVAPYEGFDMTNRFNTNWFKEDLNSKVVVPGAPIFNIHGNSNKEFLKINFSEYFTIEEIKKITEYKVMIN
jgi:hypothetical protein